MCRFGTQYEFQVDTVQEALSGLFLQLPLLTQTVRAGLFQVRFDDREVSQEALSALAQQSGYQTVHITPVIEGAGRWGQIILGAALVVVGYFAFGTTSPLGMGMITAGMGMTLGGVAQLLSRPPQLGDMAKGVESSVSSSFSNLDNLVAQGRSVPLTYGEILTGSYVYSQGVESLRNNPAEEPLDPEGIVVPLNKKLIQGIRAQAPNGEYYETDGQDDSVLAQLYVLEG